MKKLEFTITIEFEDKITQDQEIEEVGKRILSALKHQVVTEELAPEESDTFTNRISVYNKTIMSVNKHTF